jgi:Phage virion morphogenesis family
VIISFEISGDKQIERELLRFAERADDMMPAFEKLYDSFLGLERRQFDTQGRSGSGGWAPLKPRTVAAKARHDLDPRIMRATERLRRSLTNRTSPDAIKQIGPDSFFFGTRVPYAGYHQNPSAASRLPELRSMSPVSVGRVAPMFAPLGWAGGGSKVDAQVKSRVGRSGVARGVPYRVEFKAPSEDSTEAPVMGAFEGFEYVVDG